SGPDSHNTQMIMVQVVDFQISATTPVNTTPNVAGSSTVTIKAINGFTGTVSLTSSDTTHSTLSPTSLTGSGTAMLSCTFSSGGTLDRKSTRLNSSHLVISYAVFCLKKKKNNHHNYARLCRGPH